MSADITTAGTVREHVAGEVLAPTRCPRCGGTNDAHGLVHVRYGNGGGGNVRCPDAPVDVVPGVVRDPAYVSSVRPVSSTAGLAALRHRRAR